MSFTVSLEEPQIRCADSNFESCVEYGAFCNASGTGTGKTRMVFHVLSRLEERDQLPARLFVVVPGTTATPTTYRGDISNPLSPWEREARQIGFESCFLVTYESLRGSTKPPTRANPIRVTGAGARFGNVMHEAKVNNALDQYRYDEEEEYGDIYKEGQAYSSKIKPYRLGKSEFKFEYSSDFSILAKLDLTTPESYKKGPIVYENYYSPTMATLAMFADPNYTNLVILDESQMASNDTQQNRSCAALIRAVRRAYRERGNSGAYFGLLSATPKHKNSHSANYFKIFGSDNPVADHDMFVLPGVLPSQECYEIARYFDKKNAKVVAKQYKFLNAKGKPKDTKNSKEAELTDALWNTCILSNIQDWAPDVTYKVLCNAFLDVQSEKDRVIIKKSYELLQKGFQLRKDGKIKSSMEFMTESYKQAESGMAPTIARQALKKYNEHSKNKIVICFSFIKNIKAAKKWLIENGVSEDEIATIHGKEGDADSDDDGENTKRVNMKEIKDEAIQEFQTSKSLRIIIGTMKSISTSLSLHDQIGGYQRFAYICMGNDMIGIIQFVGRVARFGAQSVPYIYVCYPKELGPESMDIYEKTAKKSDFLRKALEAKRSNTTSIKEETINKTLIRLPGEYDRYFEPPSEEFEDRSTLMDNKVWMENDEYEGLYPEPSKHAFVEEDTREGRKLYLDTKFMIEYVKSIWDQNIPLENAPDGIHFLPKIPRTANQFPPDKYPSVVILKARQ